jgi:hypothetical protein
MATLLEAPCPPRTAAALVPHVERTVATGYVVRILRRAEELAAVTAEWDDLARHTLEPNAFYESWMVLPALRAFGTGKDLLFALIYGPDPRRPLGPARLCGLFPLERRHRVKGLPVGCLALWKHLYCYLCTPLLRADCAPEALDCFLDWLRSGAAGAPLAELTHIPGQGPFHQLLMDRLDRRGEPFLVDECYSRALFQPLAGVHHDTYLRAAVNSKRRTEYKRQEKLLARDGDLEWKVLERADDLSAWIDAFLALEAAGWKGRSGSAFGSREPDRSFFREMTTGAFAAGRLMFLGLFQGGRPIALKCNFLTPPGSYAFKIAYDETRANCSPGVQLELENMRRLALRPDCRWMDSCTAVRDHPMINRLWTERRLVQTLLLSTGRRSGDLLLALLPLLRWFKRALFGRAERYLSPQPPPLRGEGEKGVRLPLPSQGTGTGGEVLMAGNSTCTGTEA